MLRNFEDWEKLRDESEIQTSPLVSEQNWPSHFQSLSSTPDYASNKKALFSDETSVEWSNS